MIAQVDKDYISLRPTKLISRLLSYGLFEGRPLTTKGQWINPVVFAQFKLIKTLPQIKKVKKPIFIIGTGRSGTTILGVVMSMHRDVGFLNEPKAMWHSIYSNEDVIGSYSRKGGRFRLNAEDATPEVVTAAHKLYGAYLTAVCSKRVVDKYPELVFRIPFVRQIFPDAKFVFLVRNGWDTCYSINRWSERLGRKKAEETHDWWGENNRKWNLLLKQLIVPDPFLDNIRDLVSQITDHKSMALVEWLITMRQGLKMINKFPNDVLMVRYEDLTEDPRNTLSQIANFGSLPIDNKMMAYATKVLKAVSPHPKFRIDPLIAPLFEKLMTELGYN